MFRWVRPGLACALIFAWASSVDEIVSFQRTIPTAFFVGGRDALYRDAARWLSMHSNPADRVALAEPGTLAYYSDRSVIDMMGLVTPEVGVAMKEWRRGSDLVRWIVENFEPDYILLTAPVEAAPQLRLPLAPRYSLSASFVRPGVDRRVVLYGRERPQS